MAAMVDTNISTVQGNTKTSIVRPIANFPPSLWGDRFLSFNLDNLELDDYVAAMKEPTDEIQRLIVDSNMDSNEKLCLINCVSRLGLSYLFIKDIEIQLEKLFKELNMEEYNEFDLYTTSVNFLVFRQYGHKLSCDVFNKFKDFSTGKFKEHIRTDVKGMLCFYECTHLGIRGESILDEALAFTESHLKSVVGTLEGTLAKQVTQGLKFASQRGLPIVEARLYFSNFEEECSKYDPLPKLAKAHFIYFQLMQKEELSILTKWSKDMNFQTIATYTRDKMPELYLWVLAVFLEPRHVEARFITTKIAQLVLVLDDTFDAYATIEELRLLTDAISRWEISSMEQLPEYIKPFYQILLNEYAEWEKQLAKEGRENVVHASKKAFQDLARSYLREAEWRHSGTVPSFQEYYENGLVTSTYNLLAKSCLIGMGKIVDEEALAWYESHQKILEASELIARLHNDVVSFEFEREREHRATGIDAYMRTFRVTEDVAVKELKEMIDNAWKDINEGCLKPTKVSMELLYPILNLSRVIYVAYRFNDGFTFSDLTLKDYISLLFEASVPV
uniref:germacrene A synthase short form-like n=1 Tax=Erigeron canadensis TaxID=72917 RepID=UPI001CB8D609|nr:germacrene A synthase short form-like [Erigeron canadensis]